MTLEDLKERFKSEVDQLYARVSETSLYLQLEDRFQNLSPQVQKLVIALVAFLGLFFLFSTPVGSWMQGSDNQASFEDKRLLMKQVNQTVQEGKNVPLLPPPPDMNYLSGQIQQSLSTLQVGEDQFGGVEVSSENPSLIPAPLLQEVWDVKVNRLNLKQVVDVGFALQTLHPAVKLQDLVVTAEASYPKYFQVVFRLAALKVPTLSASTEPDEAPQVRGKK